MRPLAAAALLLLFAGPGPTAAQTPEERAQIDWAAARGRLLFELDRAAWVGTDDMMARIPNAGSAGMRGYIVERDGAGYAVTFFGGPETAPVAFYRGRVENNRVTGSGVFAADARPALTPLQRRLAAVRLRAGELGRQPCGRAPFNTAAIPPETPDGPIDLYLLTPQTEAREYPMGGHFRFTVAADGSILSSRSFTNRCITLGDNQDPGSSRMAFLFVTHLLDQVPTEIHVFTSFTSGLPVGVGTTAPRRLWVVAEDRIELVETADTPGT